MANLHLLGWHASYLILPVYHISQAGPDYLRTLLKR